MPVFSCHDLSPVSEGRASREEDSFGFGLWLVKQTEKRVVLHADLPKDFTLVSTGHHELQRVLMGPLKTNEGKDDELSQSNWSPSQWMWRQRDKITADKLSE